MVRAASELFSLLPFSLLQFILPVPTRAIFRYHCHFITVKKITVEGLRKGEEGCSTFILSFFITGSKTFVVITYRIAFKCSTPEFRVVPNELSMVSRTVNPLSLTFLNLHSIRASTSNMVAGGRPDTWPFGEEGVGFPSWNSAFSQSTLNMKLGICVEPS